jgi:tripartite-type tricarboxylate transporter receptor subunit TctC
MMRALAGLLCGLSLALSAAAQSDYPSRPIRLVVPFAPGGTIEAMSRIIGEELTKTWGQPVLVDAKPGASGNIGTQLVASAPADGYTLVFGTQGTHGTNRILFKDTRFDPVKDFEPVTMVADAPLLLVVNPRMPVSNVKELVEYIRKQPAGLDYASASTGGGAHLAGEMFARAAALKLVHVPYKGSGPARTDLIGGHVSFMFDNIASSLPSAQAGQLRALAVTGTRRTPAAPELPTMQEAGIDGVVIDTWYAIYAPAGTPKAIVNKLNAEIVRVLRLPQVAARFRALGLDIVASTPQELAARMESDLKRYGKVIREAGISAE